MRASFRNEFQLDLFSEPIIHPMDVECIPISVPDSLLCDFEHPELEMEDEFDESLADLQADIEDLHMLTLIEGLTHAFNKKPDKADWQWILIDDRRSLYSFRNCCLALGIDPEEFRESLVYMKRKGITSSTFQSAVKRYLAFA